MSLPILQTAIGIAKNPRVQRIAIGAIIGGAVGYAIVKTAEPFIFPEPEYEMIPPYTGPDELERLTVNKQLPQGSPNDLIALGTTPLVVRGHDGKATPIGQVTNVETTPDGVTIHGRITPRPKYGKPVNAAAVRPTVQPLTPAEHLAALKTIEDPATPVKPISEPPAVKNATAPAVSTFGSVVERTSMVGGGDPRKKSRKSITD